MLDDHCGLFLSNLSASPLSHRHQAKSFAHELTVVFGAKKVERYLVVEDTQTLLGSGTHDRRGPHALILVNFHVNRLIVPGVQPCSRLEF